MKLNYCPDCAATLKQQGNTNYICENGHPYYNNPRSTVDVAMVREDGQVLFSKRAREPFKDMYDLPGGFLDYNEDAYDACVREIREETSVVIRPEDLTLLSIYTHEYLPNVSVTDSIFITTKWSGEFKPQDDSAALEWKTLSFLSDPTFSPPYHDLESRIQTYLNDIAA